MPNPTPSKSDDSSALWRMSGLGIELAGSIIGMVVLGWALDSWLGTSPRWILICSAIGILGGGYNFIRSALKLNKAAMAAYQRDHSRPAPPAPPVRPHSHGVTSDPNLPDTGSIQQQLSDFERDLKDELDRARKDIHGREHP